MDIRKLQRAIVDGLEDVKAQHIQVFDTEHISALFERVIVASGTSNRQTKALASSVRDAIKAEGFPVPRMEGEGNGEWIIVDCGAAVVHIMQPTIREYYHLEELWGEKPVVMAKPVSKRSASVAEKPKKPVAKKAAIVKKEPATPVKKIATKKVAAKKVATKKPTPKTVTTQTVVVNAVPSKKVAAKKVIAKKTTVSGSKITRTVGVKTSALAKPDPVKKVVAKKATVKTVAKKVVKPK
jgi:ribosome-associated protein